MAITRNETDNHPVHTLRHRPLKATIWRNTTDKGALYNVIVTRSYRDKDTQEWRDTHSIGYDDLMNVAALMQEAHSYISGLIAKGRAPAAKVSRRAPKVPSRPGPLLQQGPQEKNGPF